MPHPRPGPIATPTTPDPFARAGEAGWERIEDFRLNEIARGPWDPGAAHGGAPAALMARAVEALGAADGLRVASLSYAFLGPVPIGSVELRCRTAKPGRLQRVADAELVAGGRVALSLRAILLRRAELPLPEESGPDDEPLPEPEGCEEIPSWIGSPEVLAFHDHAMEVRRVEGGPDRVGTSATAWMRLLVPVVPDEAPSPVQRAAACADFGNGLAHPVSFADYLFANCDLHVGFRREPEGEWVGLESDTRLAEAGSGVTVTRLHDRAGPFGVATQTLFVDRR